MKTRISAPRVALTVLCALGIHNPPAMHAQTAPDWQTAAGGKMSFDVASVKASKSDLVPPAYPLNAGDAYAQTGGRFRADFPLWAFVQFAYKLAWPSDEQQREIARLPKWVLTDRYTFEAKASGNPTKDQMRLMVQSLLADRFHLVSHFESREIPVYALSLAKEEKLGPRLVPHAESFCNGASNAPSANNPESNFPPLCDTPYCSAKPMAS